MTRTGNKKPDKSKRPGSASFKSDDRGSSKIFTTIATAPGIGGIAEVQIWGEGATNLVEQIFQSKSGMRVSQTTQGRFLYGHIVRDGSVVDEVIVNRKDSDRILGNEVIAIGCHGGGAAAREIIDSILQLGAVETEEDEILARAVAEGRISRIEEEAITALKQCHSKKAMLFLLDELGKHLLENAAHNIIGILEKDPPQALSLVKELLGQAWAIPYVELQTAFITGFPNVGKSSLFNALTDMERVIVHDAPGTTRDVLEEAIVIDGFPLRLLDAAGIGDSKTEIEVQAERFALKAMADADILLFVFDGSRYASEAEMNLYRQLDCAKMIPIINKADLPRAGDTPPSAEFVEVSALTGQGIKELRSALKARLAEEQGENGQPAVFTSRQRNLLEEAASALEKGDTSRAREILVRLLNAQAGANNERTGSNRI